MPDHFLAGRHALVTGGSRGIGAAIAEALIAAGARVTITGRDPARLAETAARLGAASLVLDATDEAGIARAFAAAQPIDILIANAGAAESARYTATPRDLWDRMIAVNLTGVHLAMRAALPGMLARNWGRVVAVASTAGLKGYPYVAPYVAAKHGVVGLVRAVALECARSGVTVNAVCPGFTDTDLVADSVARIVEKTGRTAEEAKATLAAGNPQGRLVRPEEVAGAVLWLCRPDSGAITGQSIAVAGGEVT